MICVIALRANRSRADRRS